MLVRLNCRAARHALRYATRACHVSAARSDENPYVIEYHEAMQELKFLGYREGGDLLPHKPYIDAVVLPLRRAYAWGVPSSEALDAIVDMSPNGIVEIGAGTGFWSHQLVARGARVHAFDATPCQLETVNGFHALANMGNALPFVRVSPGGAEAAALYPESTLLLCWPPRESDGSGTGERDVAMMALDALDHYSGSTVAYVGVCKAAADDAASAEHGEATSTGRYDTAGEAFEAALTDRFELVRTVALPNWPPLRDSLTLWRRRESAPTPVRSGASADAAAAAHAAAAVEQLTNDTSTGAATRARARAASLAEIRWTGFDRGWLARTLMQWVRRRRAGQPSAASAEEAQMLHRCLSRAPMLVRLLGGLAVRHLVSASPSG